MMVDIFQYSNMYTVKPAITRLASEESIMKECGAYVTRRGFAPQCWPSLLNLYSKLIPGVTVHHWIETNNVLELGIDPRRFVSFGIIKGFLRRVRRWPVIVDRNSPLLAPSEHSRRHVEFKMTTRAGSGATLSTKPDKVGETGMSRAANDSTFTLRSMGSNASLGVSPGSMPTRTPPSLTSRSPARRPTALTNLRENVPRSLASTGDVHPSISSRKTQGTLRSGGLRDRGEDQRLEEDLARYLDGRHSADEIQVRFGMSWSQLAKALGVGEVKQGKGRKGVAIILR